MLAIVIILGKMKKRATDMSLPYTNLLLFSTYANIFYKYARGSTLKFEVCERHVYSFDLVPSFYRVFGLLQGSLRDQRFADDDEPKRPVHECLAQQPKMFS